MLQALHGDSGTENEMRAADTRIRIPLVDFKLPETDMAEFILQHKAYGPV